MSMLLVLATGAVVAGCNDDSDSMRPDEVTFLFKMHGDVSGEQDFRAVTDDTDVIDAVREQLSLPEDERTLFIIGPIERGDGGGQNAPWDWHFIASEWELAEMAIELCDGNAELVNMDIDYWVDTVGQFCPWGSYAAEELPESG